MLKIHRFSKPLAIVTILAASAFAQQTMAQVWSPQFGTEFSTPGNTNTYRLNRTSIGEILPTSGLPVGQVSPQNDYRLSVLGGAITQRQRGIYGNFNTSTQWIGLGQNPTQARIYGLGMHRTDRYAFYNLDSVTRVAPTKDLIIGLGSTGTSYDPNQRILMRGFFGPLINNSRVLFSANLARGAVGINDENPLSTFFVNATGATNSPNFSTFRSMFIINRGSPSNVGLSTFSAMGQEGNTQLNLPVHGFRTQAGDSNATTPLIAANFTVNTTNQTAAGRQEAEIQWQDLNYNPGHAFPAGFTGDTRDMLSFYFRTASNVDNLRRRVMTLLGGAHVGINIPAGSNPAITAGTNPFIAGSAVNTIRLEVRDGGVLASSYFAVSDSVNKTGVIDIADPFKLLEKVQPREYSFIAKDTKDAASVATQDAFLVPQQETAVPTDFNMGGSTMTSLQTYTNNTMVSSNLTAASADLGAQAVAAPAAAVAPGTIVAAPGTKLVPQYGFIAQEIARSDMGRATAKLDNGSFAVEYNQFIPVLVAAVKQQKAVVDAQRIEINRVNELLELQKKDLQTLQEWSKEVSALLKLNPPVLSARTAAPDGDVKPAITATAASEAETGMNRAVRAETAASEFPNTKLLQSNPNPSTGYTEIFYQFNDQGTAAITITDQQGRVRKQFGNLGRGNSKVVINRGDLEPGTYIYSINVNGRIVATKQLVVLR
jgi:hypothetical protein